MRETISSMAALDGAQTVGQVGCERCEEQSGCEEREHWGGVEKSAKWGKHMGEWGGTAGERGGERIVPSTWRGGSSAAECPSWSHLSVEMAVGKGTRAPPPTGSTLSSSIRSRSASASAAGVALSHGAAALRALVVRVASSAARGPPRAKACVAKIGETELE